ncbi:hypothetical protein LXA43DRAFT_1029691 [Ganoderma leucocontextum]|nr:hypothetical protein LXA43DRAFT_1029691 [Ganoderma leucocontextum]
MRGTRRVLITAEVALSLLQGLSAGRCCGTHRPGRNAFSTRIRLTSRPISRAESNMNLPTYAEHPSLQRIKPVAVARPLSPQNSHVHFSLSTLS